MKRICIILAAALALPLAACTNSSTELTFNEVSESEDMDADDGDADDSGTADDADTDGTDNVGTSDSASNSDLSSDSSAASGTSATDICYVYVCGAVNTPGVYELSSGSRAYEAIEMAGGTTDDAAATAINLAEEVYDGEQLYVPTWDEFNDGWEPESTTAATVLGGSGTEGAESTSSLVNINTATKEELMTLTGIGESKAEAIIAYREENGSFSQIEDIMLVSGIKEAAYEKIKDSITVD